MSGREDSLIRTIFFRQNEEHHYDTDRNHHDPDGPIAVFAVQFGQTVEVNTGAMDDGAVPMDADVILWRD